MCPLAHILVPGYVYNRHSKVSVKQMYLLGSSLAQHWREKRTTLVHREQTSSLDGRSVMSIYLIYSASPSAQHHTDDKKYVFAFICGQWLVQRGPSVQPGGQRQGGQTGARGMGLPGREGGGADPQRPASGPSSTPGSRRGGWWWGRPGRGLSLIRLP